MTDGTCHHFESPKLLLDAAREHIENFETRCSAFLENCEAVTISEMDYKRGHQVIKLRIANKIPGRLKTIASDAVNNLRHSLDHAVNASAALFGAKELDNYFPFARDSEHFNKVVPKKCPSIPGDLVTFIRKLKPYGGGDDLLVRLNRITGPNKHQIILRIDMDLDHFVMNGIIFRAEGFESLGLLGWDSRKQELEIARVKEGGLIEIVDKTKLPVHVLISNSKISGSEEATAFLKRLHTKAASVVHGIEAETTRILRERAG